MSHISHSETTTLRSTLDEIISAHGLWPVLRALAARMIRRKPPPPLALSDHLRRDIGLLPLAPPARSHHPHLR